MAMISTKPLFQQVRDLLTERIAKGEWKPGMALPHEGDLAREFGVSSGTMRKALILMADQRVVERRQGRGTFVNDARSEKLAIRFSNIRDASGARISGEIKAAPIVEGMANELECARLCLTPQDRVYRVLRVRLRDGQPFMVEDASMPAALFPGLKANNGYTHRISSLAQQHGIPLGKAQERITIDRATLEIAETLGTAVDAPILLLDRVTHALDGGPVEWRIARCHLDDNCHYMVEMR